MAKGLSYTQRTLRYLRENGVIAEVVERWNPYAGKFGQRKDLFNFIDIVALYPGKKIVGVQSTSGACHSGHRKKIIEEEECTDNAIAWLKSGGHIQLISWKKKKLVRGGKAMRWTPRIEEITLVNFGIKS